MSRGRITAAIAMSALLALNLAACGGGGSGASKATPTTHETPPAASAPQSPVPLPQGPGDDPGETPITPAAPTTPPPNDEPSAPPADLAPLSPVDRVSAGSKRDAWRFLEQSTFGPTLEELERVMQIGIGGYLEAQLQTQKTGYSGFTRTAYVQADDCKTQANDPASAASICARTHYTLFEVQRQFFANAMSGEDQLRQRVAFALSQIFVVSGTEVKHAAGMASYQNLLLDGAFGNFRDLLEAVTLHPAMGMYLDMVNNGKGNAALGTKPNENFARELMQLFTLGTQRLHLDGSAMLDAHGDPLPAYTQADVEALARVLTGWTYSPWVAANSRWVNPPKLVGDMVAIESRHDVDAKQFLGLQIPAGEAARSELEQALDQIFQHSNVGPFISQRLIQHLVTSNPSPAYIARVARTFNDDGRGVRGDLRAVVIAILLDEEARGAAKTDSSYGKLKEPALFMTSFLRALGGVSDGVYLRAQAAALGQDVFNAPSVFNYYSPLQRVGEGTLLGPEFGIFDGASALARIDFVYQLVYGNGAAPDATVPDSTGTSVLLDPAVRGASVGQLMIDGLLSRASIRVLDDALAKLPVDDELARARASAYALGVSAQFQVQR